MATNEDLRPSDVPARAGRLAVLALVAVLATLVGAFLAGRDADRAAQAPFLEAALGEARPAAGLTRRPAADTTVRLRTGGYEVRRGPLRVGLRALDAGGGTLQPRANGASRRTWFGWESLTVTPTRTEQFLTVTERQGPRAWRWELDTLDLRPRLGADGRIGFARPDGSITETSYLDRVRILDAERRDVTPRGLRWSVTRHDGRWSLAVDLDDSELPLPYVIDPAIVVGGSNTLTGASPLAPARPGSSGDLLVAQVFTRGTGAISAPAGWTQIQQTGGTAVRQATYWAISNGSNSTSFSWTGGGNGGAAVIAFGNPHPTAPIQASSSNTGTTSPATASGLTTTHPDELVAAFVGQATNGALAAPTGMTSRYSATQGGPAAGRLSILGATVAQAAAGATGNKTTATTAEWMAQLVAIRQAPDDGSGTLTTGTAGVAAGSTGSTITFTYTAGVQGIAAGAVALDVPAGWSAPSTTGTAAGFTTASTGTVGVSGQRITVTGVTLNAGATMTVTYGSKASGGPGATASATTGSAAWTALARGTSGGTLTALGASPAIWQYAADGSGTMSVSPTQLAGGASTTLTFTYTAAAGGMSNGDVTVVLPSGWTAPNSTPGAAGYTTASSGTVAWNGGTRTLTVAGVTLTGGATLTTTYGAGAGGAVTVPAGSGTVTWQTAQRSLSTGALAGLAASPTSVYNSAPTATVALAPVSPTTNQTLTATATKDDLDGDTVTLTYVWKVDGATRKTTSGSASLTDTLDLSGAGDGDKGQTVTVEVTPSDGSTDGNTVSDSELVANSAPSITSVTVDQAAPTTNDTLTVTVASADADGDARTYAYQWQRDGTDIAGATAATLDLSQAGNGQKGDELSVVVVADDGTTGSAPSTSAAVTIQNAVPTATVALAPSSPSTNQILTATATRNDLDGDTVTLTYVWKVDGVTRKTTIGSASLTDTLDLAGAGDGDKGQTVTLEVTANDGTADGVAATDSEIVGNSPPAATVALSPAAPGTEDVVTATATTADADMGDTVTLTYVWKVDGATVKTTAGSVSLSDTLDLSVAGNGDGGETVSVEVTPDDGTVAGPTETDDVVVDLVPDHLAFTSSVANLPSGTSRTLTVEVRDADGALVTDDGTTQVAVAKTAGSGTVAGLGTATASGGIATIDVDGTLAGPITITATAAGLAGAGSGFTVVHGSAARIGLAASGSTLSGATATLTATILDAAGNTVLADSVTAVTFAKTSGTGTVGGLGADTATAGVASLDVTNLAAGTIDLEASAPGLAPGTASYVIGAGTASTATSAIDAAPGTIVADGSSTSTITVRLKDAAGNDLAGSGGVVALGLAGGGGLGPVTDNGDGTYTATLTSPTTVGVGAVTGTLNGSALADTASVTYEHGPAVAIELSDSGSSTAGAAHTLTATIVDANGNTVTSDNATVVSFAKASGAGTVTGLSAATAAAGVATNMVTNRLAGTIDVDATATGLATGTTTWTIAVGPVVDADSTVTSDRASVVANGTEAATITVALRDAGGNPVAGKTVTLDDGAASSTIAGGGATGATGEVTFTVTSTTVEAATYTATDTTDALTLTDTVTITFTFGDSTPPANSITTGSAIGAVLTGTTAWYRPAAAGSFTLSSAVTDAGSGPASAAYPLVSRAGWTHAQETVSTPAGGPFVSSAFSWTNAASGDFDVVVTAADLWSPANTTETTISVREDSTAPVPAALCDGAACPAGWFASAPVSVALSAADTGAGLDQIRYTTDGSDPTVLTGTPYAGPFAVAAEGVTTVKYRAFDRVGNDSGVVSQAIRIDTVAPQTTIDGAPAAATQDTTPTFAFGSDETATFQWRLDGGSWTQDPGPVTLGVLAESTYTFEVRATDAAGNVDMTPAAFVFTVDTTPADTSITAAPAAAASSTAATFSFTASDAGPSFQCSLDGGAFADCTSPESYTGLTEAAHTFAVRAKDAAGNVDPTPATWAWTVDLTPPDSSFLATPPDPGADATPGFDLGSSESPATYECKLDTGGWSPCATPFTTPVLADGSHTLELRAADAAGNVDPTPASYTWLVDSADPTGNVTAPADGALLTGAAVALASDSADAGSGVAAVQFQRSAAGAGSWAPQPSPWNTTLAADGDYDLRVVTTDAAGNAFTSPAITVTVDNTAPSLSVSAPGTVNLASPDPATITATASDGGTGVASVEFEQCTAANDPTCSVATWLSLGLDTTPPYAAAWPIPSDGSRLLRVRATDEAGKQTTELALVTVDRTRPVGSLTAPAAGADLRGSTVALAATASDVAPGAVDTVSFQLSPAGAGAWTPVGTDGAAPYGATLDTTGFGDGLYDLRALTTDTAANAEQSPTTIQVRIDNTAPTGDVTFPADGAAVRGTVALTSDSADAGSGVDAVVFERSPAGAGSWTAQAAAFDTTGVADGLYDLRVTTTDAAGSSFTSASVTVRVDNTAPTGSITAPAAGANLRGTVALAGDSADGGSGVAAVQFQRAPAGTGTWTNQAASWNTTLVPDGLYDLRVVTIDQAGNTFTSPSLTLRVDNTPPTGAITSPASGAELGAAPVALTSDSSDAGGSGVASVVFERSPAGAGAWTSTPASWETVSGPDAVADGGYDLRVVTTDAAGNSFTSPVVSVLLDRTAPTTTASLAPASPSNAPVTVSFAADDGAGSGVALNPISYRVDGGSWQFGSAVVVAAPGDRSNDGSHLVEFYATDDVGSVEVTKSVTVVIDTTPPSGSAADPGDYLRGIANLGYTTGAADVASVQFQFSPAGMGAWSNIGAADIAPPYTAGWNTALVADGPYDVRAVVTDAVGNVATELLPGLPKTVDNAAPAGSVSSPAPASFQAGAIDVTATATDAGSGVAVVRFEVEPAGAGSFTVFGTQVTPVAGSTYRESLSTGSYPDGPAYLRVVVTDVAGNEATSVPVTINIDNDAPAVSLDDPPADVSGTVALGATAATDAVQVVFERSPAGAGTWTAISTDVTPGDGFTASWNAATLPDGPVELRARAIDAGGNTGTSATRTTRVDNTQPSGSISTPSAGASVGGSAVSVAAAASDAGGSGVASVAFEVKPFGSATFAVAGTDTSAPYVIAWDASGAPDGTAELRAVITDAAGNSFTTAVVPVIVDSTGPTVSLADPGAVVGGTVALSATTGGGATRVRFAVSPANAGAWTELGEDAAFPFGALADTAAYPDGLYDLRAVGFDGLGNPSAPSLREDVRFDNTGPSLVGSAPADGSVSAAASQIVLTASEPVTAVGATLDGGPAPAPSVAGSTLTFATGALADGLHVLAGELEDASGTRAPFRVAVTIESAVGADRPPVELSARPGAPSTLTAPGGLASVTVPASSWPPRPSLLDFIVLRVDLSPPAPVVGTGLLPGSQRVEVTARWALAGTLVTRFDAPIDVVIPNSSGSPVVPASSQDASTWRVLPQLSGPILPDGSDDGWHRDGSGAVHVLTRHLTWFALLRDDEAPTAPRHLAGVVADDGLTLRWIPGSDASGQLGNVLLYVDGQSSQEFEPTQFEVKLGAFAPGDTRRFTMVQLDAAGNASPHTEVLHAVPPLAGLSLEQAAAALTTAGFRVGAVRTATSPQAAPGTVVEPAGIRLAVDGTPVDLILAGEPGSRRPRLVFRVVGPKWLRLVERARIPARISVSKRAKLTASIFTRGGKRLHGWRLDVKPGTKLVRLPLPKRIRRPGTYTVRWVAQAGTETVRRSAKVKLVAPRRR